MKILMISHIPENLDMITGGVESVTVNLLNGFSNLDVELTVISFRKEVKKQHIYKFAPNIRIYYYPYNFVRSTKIFFTFWGSLIVFKQVKLLMPDIIHLQGNGSSLLLLLKLRNKNVVITPHADLKGEYLNFTTIKKKINHKIVFYIEYIVMKKFNNFIFISEYLKNILNEQKVFGKINCQAVIYNPVNPLFLLVKDNEQINRLNILYIGEISKRKGLIDLIKSMIELKAKGIIYHLNIVGGFNNNIIKNLITSTIKENGLESQITFLGWLSQKSIAELMDHNGVFVLPSNQESLPMSLIESMSSGKLVIATDVGGISEIVKHEITGYIFKKNDINQLSSILEKLYYDPLLYHSISHNARLYAMDNFSPLMICQKTKYYYSSIINQ
jgi:glycosyltransferase involved in cell wall biosynthesis